MGNLVFQATLGGQVNLVGPNTASTYNINVPAVAGTMVTTGDTGSVSSTMLASSLSLTTPNINVATGTSLKVTSGFYSTSSSSFTYTDGIVMDYTTGLGRISVGTSDGLAFYNAGVATTELMRIDSSGNVGIGTSSPGNKLEVNGAIRSKTSTGGVFNLDSTTTSTTNTIGSYANNGAAFADLNYSGAQHIWLSSGSEKMRIDSSGNLLVGTTTAITVNSSNVTGCEISPGTVIASANNAVSMYFKRYNGTGNLNDFWYGTTYVGGISTNGSTITFSGNALSDSRWKQNIAPITNALNAVMQTEFVTFEFKEGNKPSAGVTAQQLQTVDAFLPYVVNGETDEDYKAVDYNAIIGFLGKAIQEQQAIIQQLQADVTALKAPQ